MKILMISKSQVSAAYHGKLRELARLGVKLTLVVPPHWGAERLEVRHSDEYEILVNRIVFSGQNHLHFYYSLPDLRDFDLIHLEEEPWSLVTFQIMRHCRRFRRPVLFFTWQNIYKRFPLPFRWIENATFRNAAGAIAGNTEAAHVIRKKGYSAPLAVIPQLGVDPEVFRSQDSSRLRATLGIGGKFVIGYLGRVIEEKGVADLLVALSKLPETCVLLVVGQGSFKDKAIRLATNLRLGDRIHWIPSVSSLEVPAYMNAFDALVLPSRTRGNWKEQFGRVLIEAMACKTPVIGSDSGEIPNVIDNAGLVFPEGQVDALVDAVTRLMQSHGLAEALASQGRDRVLTRFTHRRIAQHTFEFYRKVLGNLEVNPEALNLGWGN